MLLILISFSCCSQKTPLLLDGCYDFQGGTYFVGLYPYDQYNIEGDTIQYRGGATGYRHISWKGVYVRQDSMLDVLVYFGSTMDGNIGWQTADTRQKRIQLVVRETNEGIQLLRKLPTEQPDRTAALSALPIMRSPAEGLYQKGSDTVQPRRFSVVNCGGYGGEKFRLDVTKKWLETPTCRAEVKVQNLLEDHLNANLKRVSIEAQAQRISSATALLKMKSTADFPLPTITVLENSTPYAKEELEGTFTAFIDKKLRAFNNPDLQDYLLVTILVQEDDICVLPPARSGILMSD